MISKFFKKIKLFFCCMHSSQGLGIFRTNLADFAIDTAQENSFLIHRQVIQMFSTEFLKSTLVMDISI